MANYIDWLHCLFNRERERDWERFAGCLIKWIKPNWPGGSLSGNKIQNGNEIIFSLTTITPTKMRWRNRYVCNSMFPLKKVKD